MKKKWEIKSPVSPYFYLLALYNEKDAINRVFRFKSPKDAKDFIINHGYQSWTAYLIDIRQPEDRTFIKLN